MAEYFKVHPDNPQQRLLEQAVAILRDGAIMAFPTDSCYALGCRLDDKEGQERIRQLRQLDKNHHFTLMCRDLSDLGTYAQVSNANYRLLRAHTPGAYTYILPASAEVPRRLHHPKRKTIGLRIPDNAIVQELLKLLNEPLLSVTLMLPEFPEPFTDGEVIREYLEARVDIIIDGGYCSPEPTTVIDLESGTPEILRIGRGDPAPFEV